ncbi:Uncharacterised protein [Mycobacteroides abscessus subsp. abscessus]|nr:Uncharacterised protein [Mycobacteroides abscessus subsp. abscessus]
MDHRNAFRCTSRKIKSAAGHKNAIPIQICGRSAAAALWGCPYIRLRTVIMWKISPQPSREATRLRSYSVDAGSAEQPTEMRRNCAGHISTSIAAHTGNSRPWSRVRSPIGAWADPAYAYIPRQAPCVQRRCRNR